MYSFSYGAYFPLCVNIYIQTIAHLHGGATICLKCLHNPIKTLPISPLIAESCWISNPFSWNGPFRILEKTFLYIIIALSITSQSNNALYIACVLILYAFLHICLGWITLLVSIPTTFLPPSCLLMFRFWRRFRLYICPKLYASHHINLYIIALLASIPTTFLPPFCLLIFRLWRTFQPSIASHSTCSISLSTTFGSHSISISNASNSISHENDESCP